MPHTRLDPTEVHAALYDPEFAQKVYERDLPHIKEMCREQLLGDRELLADIDAGRSSLRRESDRANVVARLFYVETLALRLGMELPPLLDEGRDVLADLG